MKTKYITSLFVSLLLLIHITVKAQNPTVYLSSTSGSYSVIEGTTYSFHVNLYSVSTTNIVVDITTTDQTAGVADYTPLTTTVTIPAGQLSNTAVLSIPTTNDATIEGDETLLITGTVTSANTANATANTTLSIIDNDTVPTLNSYYSYTANEFNNFPLYYNLSNPYSSNVVVHWVTTIGTAGTSDFTAVNNTITIPAGQTSGYINIGITDDVLVEPDETFTITGTVTSGNTSNLSTTTAIIITDNDTPPTVSLESSLTAYEGNGLGFFINLDRIYNANVVVQFTTTNGTAGSADYTATPFTTTITPGNASVYLTIPITDDSLDEPLETFTVTGTVTSGNTINTSVSTTATIIDNDGLPDFYIRLGYQAPAYFSSIEEGLNAPFSIGLTQASSTDTVVQITTANGTAGSSDYTPITLTATIPAGSTYAALPTFEVPTILDPLQEADETFVINGTVTSGNTYNTSGSATYTILDNYNLNAQNDTVISIFKVGTTFPLLANDTLHGLPLVAADVIISLGSNTIGATIDSQGIVSIPSTLAIGYYQLTYTICEVANSGNCDTALITFIVESPLKATYDVSYTDYNGDGYTSAGDLVTFQFKLKNNGNAPISAIELEYAYNITVLGGPVASLNAGQTDNTTFTAVHILTQDDINFGYFTDPTPIQGNGLEVSFKGQYYGNNVTDWAQMGNPFALSISDGIKVKAFVDSNANGIQDGSEIDFPLGHFNYEINNDGILHNLYSTPYYLYESNPTTIYNLSYTVDSNYAPYNTCSVSYPNVTVATGSGITTYNFPISVTPYQELSVNLMGFLPAARPGFLYSQYISYTNNSNLTVTSGTVTFTKDSALSIYDVPGAGVTITPTGFTYNFTNLLPYQTRYLYVIMQVPTIPTVALGQLVTNTAAITIPAGDIMPLNNTSTLTQTIVGSFDPNEKTESHGGQIIHSGFTSNDYLTYTIRFENTGTANAINVNVEDFLDSKLEPSSIKMIDASAAYSLERIGNHLKWKFSGIDLPPSLPNDEVTGHGYIVFKVKPKPGYAIGDVIPNTANIYFDFNPAIVTNACTTQFVQSLNANSFAFDKYTCYPNPVKNTLFISNLSALDTVEITSVLGQTMISKKVNALQTELNLSGLSNGIYFVKATSAGQEKTIKIVKE